MVAVKQPPNHFGTHMTSLDFLVGNGITKHLKFKHPYGFIQNFITAPHRNRRVIHHSAAKEAAAKRSQTLNKRWPHWP